MEDEETVGRELGDEDARTAVVAVTVEGEAAACEDDMVVVAATIGIGSSRRRLEKDSRVVEAGVGDDPIYILAKQAERARAVGTIFNHSLASALGAWITHAFSPEVIKWIIVGSFLAMAAWILVPDKGDDDALKNHSMRFGVFGVTFITFFLAEMGDKTQIATVALTVKYAAPVLVVIGTTIGMLIADVPAVWIGDKLAQKVPVKLVRIASAVLFAAIGILAAFEYTPTEL